MFVVVDEKDAILVDSFNHVEDSLIVFCGVEEDFSKCLLFPIVSC